MRLFLQPRRSRVGPLEVVEFPASAGAPVVVCLHGYGADAADLAPLAAELELPGPARWLFPEAPLGVGPFGPGRAWFPIDEAELMKAQVEGGGLDVSGGRPDGLDAAVACVGAFVAALEVPWGEIILGGFSQGAMVALEAALGAPEAPRGLFLLSTALVDEDSLASRAAGRAGLAFFQSHGRSDPLLPFAGAQRLHEGLASAGLAGDFCPFEGGHTVAAETAKGLERYLAGRWGGD